MTQRMEIVKLCDTQKRQPLVSKFLIPVTRMVIVLSEVSSPDFLFVISSISFQKFTFDLLVKALLVTYNQITLIDISISNI